MIAAAIRAIFQATRLAEARQRLTRWSTACSPPHPRWPGCWRPQSPSCWRSTSFPARTGPSCGAPTRWNGSTVRSAGAPTWSGSSPTTPPLLRLAGALLIEQNDEWQIARRYLSQESLELVLVDEPTTQEATQLTPAMSHP